MIELISQDNCINCDKCVDVCPTNVFDRVVDGHPVIARQSDCQTCFMCEAHCPTDALYVSPLAGPAEEASPYRDEAALLAAGQFGAYRRRLGWGRGQEPGSLRDRNSELPALLRSYDDVPALQ